MEVVIFEASHPASAETVLMHINFISHCENVLCAAKQLLGIADAAEGLQSHVERMKRQLYRPHT